MYIVESMAVLSIYLREQLFAVLFFLQFLPLEGKMQIKYSAICVMKYE